MSLSGPFVHRQLMDAYTAGQAQLEAMRVRTDSQERASLRDDRGAALVSLAEYYLPELTREAIQNTWVDVRPKVSDILLRKEDQQRRFNDSLQRISAQRQQLETELVALNEQMDQSLQQQQELSELVSRRLREDPPFMELSDRAALAEGALERAESNLEEIDQDAARKLPAYDQSTLFRYLYDRGFGTPEYTKRGFTRRMDRSLARFINYNEARQGYQFLKQTPEQMRKIISQDRDALNTVMKELQRRRDTVAKELGLSAKIEEVEKLEAKRDANIDSLERVRLQVERTQTELSELDDKRGPFYQEAIGLFRDLLSRCDTRDLQRQAEATVDITDDQIVARLSGVDAEFEKLEQASKDRQKALGRQQNFLVDLGRLIQRFRAARFDSSRSEFSDRLDIMDVVDRARERSDMDYLWDQIRRAQSWGPTTMDKVGRAASHPLTQVLIGAMANAAGSMLQGYARRAGERSDDSDYRSSRKNRSYEWGGDSSDDDRDYNRNKRRS